MMGIVLKFKFSDTVLNKDQDEPSTQEGETNTNKIEEEIIQPQEEKEVTYEENIPLTEESSFKNIKQQ